MRKFFGVLLALTLFPGAALAQSVPFGGLAQGQVWTSAQFNTALLSKQDYPITTGPISVTNGYQFAPGVNALRLSTNPQEPSIMLGPNAGASLPAGHQFATFLGPNAGESFTAAVPEMVAIGQNAAIADTGAGGIVAVGISTCAAIITGGAQICIGNDAMRDAVSGGGDIAIGSGALADGNWSGSNIGIGALDQAGAASTITFGGSIGGANVGDQLHFSFASSNACTSAGSVNCTTPVNGFPITYTYAITSADTSLALLAQHVAAGITANVPIRQLYPGGRQG